MPRPRLLTSDVVLAELRAAFTANNGFAPTIEQLRVRLGVASTRTVWRYLSELERDGHITRHPHSARGIRLKRGRGRCPTCGQTFTAGK